MPNIRSLTPLSEDEEYQLKHLLDRRSQSLPEAQAARDRERDREARLRAQQDNLAAEEARLARRLAQLRIDIDVVSSEIFKIAPSGVDFRHVNGRLQQLNTLVPTQSFFNSPADNLDRDQLMLLAENALSAFEASTRSKARPLRDRMAAVEVEIGPDAPGGSDGPIDGRAALVQAILAAGKKAKGKTP